MSALLSLSRVTAGYVADIDILRDVSIEVEAKRVTGLIGLNGAGKSTLMKTICGFLRPAAGTIRYDGSDITGIAPHTVLDHGIWYIPQESSLFPYMSVADNLRLPLERLARRNGGLDTDARFEDMLAHFEAIRPKLGSQAGDLSGGQQKMVEFAKAYLVRPRLCLIDEPSIGLAPKIAAEVYRWIELFSSQDMAILLIDHNVRRVVRMAEYVYVMSLGEISAQGRREDFAGDLHDQVRAWLGVNF